MRIHVSRVNREENIKTQLQELLRLEREGSGSHPRPLGRGWEPHGFTFCILHGGGYDPLI